MLRRAFAAGALPAALCFASGAAPSITHRDAGELTAAAFLLDVAHPTGFAADLLAVRLAMLVPVGDLAFRANLAVGALMALACGCAAVLTARLVEGDRALAVALGGLAGAVLAASSTVLRAATAMEVYAGALLVSLGALTLTGGTAPLARRRRLAALCLGATLATHATARPAALVALAVTSWPLLRHGSSRSRLRAAVAVAALAMTTAALVLYLPLAARRGGPIDWGDPSTPRAVLDHLSAASIRRAFAGRMLVAWRLPEDLAAAVRLILDDLGVPFALLGVAGVLRALRVRAAMPMAAVALADLAYAVAVNPMGAADRQTLFVAEAGLAVCGAAALGAMLRPLVARLGPRATAAGVVALAAVVLLRRDGAWAGRADGWVASEVLGGAGALGAVPVRSIVLCGSDDGCGGAMWAQWVEGERPDVTVLPRPHLGALWTWRRLQLRRSLLHRFAAPDVGQRGDARLRWLLASAPDRVRWEGDAHDAPGTALFAGETPVFARLTPSPDDANADRDAVAWVASRMPATRGAGARWIGATVLFAAGAREAHRDISAGVPLWRAALGVWPGHVASWIDLGLAEARAGRPREAAALTGHALDLDPDRPRAWSNLAVFLDALGDAGGAADARREASRRARPEPTSDR